MATELAFDLEYRRQELARDERGRAFWRVVTERRRLAAAETALLLCDVWDRHWSRGATERVEAMVPRIDAVVRAVRERGSVILHAPSDMMAFYEGHPARERVRVAPAIEVPPLRDHPDPPLPVDASDHGSDTGEEGWYRAWSRQHPGIGIDPERDGISEDGTEIWRFLRQRGVSHLLIAGVHTNMCVLGRSFGIRAMVRRGMDVALVRDLTDAMYNPAMPPYVSHEEGTRLVIEYIEKFWCPTVTSAELMR